MILYDGGAAKFEKNLSLHSPSVSALYGRRVDLPRILSHELVSVPLAIADTNGQLRSGNKSVLIELLSGGMEHTQVTPVPSLAFDTSN